MAKYFRRDKERRRKGSTELSPTTPAFSADPAGREPVWTCSFSTRQLESDLESMFLLARRRKTVRSIRLTISKLSSHDRFSSNRASKQHEPLNILFCGADDFSVYSLRALRTLQEERPEKIAGIEVVCRPDKYTGRGLKKLHEVPIKSVTSQLGLSLHQIDTFKGWSPPSSINLVVAVSFGLLVPARILKRAQYGGLNVHPSMLPDLRGPAPIVHTLLKQRSHTGVTLQTMHPTRFDHGTVLAQTPAPGIAVPEGCSPDQLLQSLGPVGAEMLCQGIEKGLFVDPQLDVRAGLLETQQLDHAPKITPEDRHIDWNTWKANDILLRDRVLGRLWDSETYKRCSTSTSKRVTFHGPWTLRTGGSPATTNTPGQPIALNVEDPKNVKFGISTCDHELVLPAAATIDGEKKGTGLAAMINRLCGG